MTRPAAGTQPAAAIMWFRMDLRLADNPALDAAVRRGGPVIPVYIWAPEDDAPWTPGSASRLWLHGSLAALDTSLRERGARLVLRTGPALDALVSLVRETGAGAVYWNRRIEPAGVQLDARIESALRSAGVEVSEFDAALLFDSSRILNKQGKPFQVFGQFWKACLNEPPQAGLISAPQRLMAPVRWPGSARLEGLALTSPQPWARKLMSCFSPGEAAASARLDQFVEHALDSYIPNRDRPDCDGTSQLSAHLHFGEVSARQVWQRVQEAPAAGAGHDASAAEFLRQLGWREFAASLLRHFPGAPGRPLRARFSAMPWRTAPGELELWQRGWTGYPIVDAGMRQLWATGWMHNRVRMIAASFLTKDLLIPWQEGAKWFWDTLADADLANNTLGWQWTAGCGADAAPYFRVFNPVLQGRKFDPEGRYVRRWLPELSLLPTAFLHAPWEASESVLTDAKVALGTTYPVPMVCHASARRRALAAYESVR